MRLSDLMDHLGLWFMLMLPAIGYEVSGFVLAACIAGGLVILPELMGAAADTMESEQ